MVEKNSSSFFLFSRRRLAASISFFSFVLLSFLVFSFSFSLVICCRSSSLFFYLPSFLLFLIRTYPQSNQHRPYTITSSFFSSSFSPSLVLSTTVCLFSLLYIARTGERKKITTIITNTKRTASGTKVYADSRFCTLTTLFSTFSLSFSSFFSSPS